MTIHDIKTYLGDTTDLAGDQIEVLAEMIYRRLDYSPMYEQIDNLAALLTSAITERP